ncbi:unnamed protein product [Effrenium voratum]|nr:unnamed protein product [Effrenium voratum]
MPTVLVEPNFVTYGAALSALSRGEKWREALELFTVLPQRGVESGIISVTATLTACGRAACWQEALELLSWARQEHLQPTVICYSSALSALERGNRWDCALGLFAEMEENYIAPNTISFSAAISACEKCGQWQTSLRLLEQMYHREVAPDVVCYSAAISSCEKAAEWAMALFLLAEMPRARCEANAISYNAAMGACENCNQWQAAIQLFEDMEPKVTPTVRTFNVLISACRHQWQLATGLFSTAVQRQLELSVPGPWRELGSKRGAGRDLSDFALPEEIAFIYEHKLGSALVTYNSLMASYESLWPRSLSLLEEMQSQASSCNMLRLQFLAQAPSEMEWALSAACFAAYLLGLSQFICRALIHRKAAFQFCQKCASEMRRAFRQASPQEKHLRRQVVLLKSSRAITHATCWLAVMTFSLQSIVFNIAMEQTRWMSDQATWGQVILTVILMVIVQVSSAMNEHTLDMWYIFCQLLSALLTSSYSCSTDQALTASMFVFLFISGPAAMFANRRILIFVSHLGLFGLAVLRCLTEDFPVGMRGGPAYAMTFFMFLCVASVISQFSHHQCRREVEAGVREKNSATQLSAASELLQLTCDAVLELDHDLRLRVHSSQLATMLLHRPHASLKGMKFTKFIAQDIFDHDPRKELQKEL